MKETKAKVSVEDRYSQWKSLVPVLYHWFANHSLVWPSLSCRWGPQLKQATYKNCRQFYLSEQTDGSVPNTLVIANCEVVKPRVAAAEHIAKVNRIRELPQNSKIVATHNDSPDMHYILHVLNGHKDNAEFALAMCQTEPFVLSRGKDKYVVLWSLHDHISTLASEPGSTKSKAVESPSIKSRGIFQGHKDIVEDVQFCPTSAQEFCSVGDDSCLLLWDARTGSTPVVKVEKAHNADLHSVDWNPHDVNLILTGSADNCVHLFDRRNLTSGEIGLPIHKFKGHNAAVLCWSPDKSSIFGTSVEDGILNIWDYEKVGKMQYSSGQRTPNAPPGLFFQHAGHRDKVVEFQWNASDPWTIMSVSADCNSSGGSTLQIWQMLDFFYRPEGEVLTELDKSKSHIFSCESE